MEWVNEKKSNGNGNECAKCSHKVRLFFCFVCVCMCLKHVRMKRRDSISCKAMSPVFIGLRVRVVGFYCVGVHTVHIFPILLIFEIKFTRKKEQWRKKIIANAHKLCNFVCWNAIWIALYVIVLNLEMGCPLTKREREREREMLLYTLSVMLSEEQNRRKWNQQSNKI